MAQQHTQAAGSSDAAEVIRRIAEFDKANDIAAQTLLRTGWQKSISAFGMTLTLSRDLEPIDAACERCNGLGRWRPPYAACVIPCDLCTSMPISAASATSASADTPAGSRA